MALVVLPEGQQRSGKQGGIVWSHNAGGPYVRNRAIPTNPNTARQIAIRNSVRSLAIAWANTLTQAQRDAWDTYGANVSWVNRLGQTISLSGISHFIRSNTPRLQAGLARVDDAPTIFNIATAELLLGATASEATQIITITFDDTQAWTSEDGAFQQWSAGLPQNPGIKFFGGPYRMIGNGLGDSGVPLVSPQTFTSGYPFADGQRIWLRSRIGRADGRLSEFAEINFLAAA